MVHALDPVIRTSAGERFSWWVAGGGACPSACSAVLISPTTVEIVSRSAWMAVSRTLNPLVPPAWTRSWLSIHGVWLKVGVNVMSAIGRVLSQQRGRPVQPESRVGVAGVEFSDAGQFHHGGAHVAGEYLDSERVQRVEGVHDEVVLLTGDRRAGRGQFGPQPHLHAVRAGGAGLSLDRLHPDQAGLDAHQLGAGCRGARQSRLAAVQPAAGPRQPGGGA